MLLLSRLTSRRLLSSPALGFGLARPKAGTVVQPKPKPPPCRACVPKGLLKPWSGNARSKVLKDFCDGKALPLPPVQLAPAKFKNSGWQTTSLPVPSARRAPARPPPAPAAAAPVPKKATVLPKKEVPKKEIPKAKKEAPGKAEKKRKDKMKKAKKTMKNAKKTTAEATEKGKKVSKKAYKKTKKGLGWAWKHTKKFGEKALKGVGAVGEGAHKAKKEVSVIMNWRRKT